MKAKAEARLLVERAKEARENAYAPYYKVYVGAALLGQDGSVHAGCNVENAAGGAIMCAEGNALGAAVVNGVRKFRALALVGDDRKLLYPCGICLQKLAEFAPHLDIYIANGAGRIVHHRLHDLLTHPTRL